MVRKVKENCPSYVIEYRRVLSETATDGYPYPDMGIKTGAQLRQYYDHSMYWMTFPSEIDNDKYYAYSKISTGGMRGGNCWGDEPSSYTDDESKELFDMMFDRLILEVYPEISYMKYKKFKKELVKQFKYSENEYYGNSTDYVVEYIDIEDFMKKIKDGK